jgi:hypothetical protein
MSKRGAVAFRFGTVIGGLAHKEGIGSARAIHLATAVATHHPPHARGDRESLIILVETIIGDCASSNWFAESVRSAIFALSAASTVGACRTLCDRFGFGRSHRAVHAAASLLANGGTETEGNRVGTIGRIIAVDDLVAVANSKAESSRGTVGFLGTIARGLARNLLRNNGSRYRKR